MIGEIIGWILSGFQIEAAIIAWKISGTNWLNTLIRAVVMGTLGILIPYIGFTVIILTLEKIFGVNISIRLPQWVWNKNRKRKRNIKLKLIIRDSVRKALQKAGNHPHFLLFFLNLLPMVPYLTLATVIAVRLSKTKWGILAVLTGNWLKIALFISIAFRL